MTDTIIIALDKLDLDPNNARKTRTNESIEEMAASLKGKGLIQNLVVREGEKKGHYLVTAGGTRWAGFKLLAANGDIKKNHGIRCIVRTAEEATEISLAENIVRTDMHPVDALSAFAKLVEEGKSIADIAARFGKTETHVKQRLALAKVSPLILQLYREEEISFDQLKAFTVSDDHAEQERVWNELPRWNRESNSIRRALTNTVVSATDKRVRFIGGLSAYETAGGPVRRDLFDKPDSGFILDAVKLDSMVADKLQSIAEEVKAEGWANVDIIPEYDHAHTAHLQRYVPQRVPLTEEELASRDQLQAEYDVLEELIESGEADDDAEARADELVALIDALNDRTSAYAPDLMAAGTAFISLDYQGKPRIERGFMPREEQASKGGNDNDNETSHDDDKVVTKTEIVYPATLIESLSAQKTAILRAELMNNAHIALAATVHALLLSMDTYNRHYGHSSLKLSLSFTAIDKRVEMTGGSIAQLEVEQRAAQISERIPGDPVALWDWCLEQSTEELLDLLAFAAAQSVNVVELKNESNSNAATHGNRLANALKIDMASWYQPTAESCFTHLNRNSIQVAVTEAAGEQAASAVASAKKKAEAVIIAERLVKDTNWLPKYVRIEQMNATNETGLESMDDIEDDVSAITCDRREDIDPSETGELDTDDFEQAAE